MRFSLNALNAAYHASELLGMLSKLNPEEAEVLFEAFGDSELSSKASESLRRLIISGGDRRPSRRKSGSSFDEFRFEDVMQRLRNVVMHSHSAVDAAEVDWLLKIILTSPVVFESVRQVDNFLSNMTGTEHATKSTGRDRVVDWYFKHINTLPLEERNYVYLKIARHIFATGKSNYREWKDVLYGSSSR